MPGNTFGQVFSITTFGESHGGAVGVVIDGCPSGVPLSEADIQPDLDRRKPGQSDITTPRQEKDTIRILSGVFQGMTTGTPILLLANNEDARPQDYQHMLGVFRPSHADYTYIRKYGHRDWRGSGRASARETLARVAAGAVAKKFLGMHSKVSVLSYVEQVGDIVAAIEPNSVTFEQIEANEVRCPDPKAALEMIKLIQSVQAEGDSIGGVIRGVIKNVPPGLGEPVFHKFNADLGAAMLGINAVKGFEIGSGFKGATMRGSEHNDPLLVDERGAAKFTSNNAGGTLGGITSGQDIIFRVAFKPVSTIGRTQQTINQKGESVELTAHGRHDPCVLPRAVPIVDAMCWLVILDHLLRHHAQKAELR